MERMETKFGSEVMLRLGLKGINGQAFSAPLKINQHRIHKLERQQLQDLPHLTTTFGKDHNTLHTLDHQLNE